MVKKEQDRKSEVKLYECQKCGDRVVADDYNFAFHICITCENKSGSTWS